jgi:hypothetical protein
MRALETDEFSFPALDSRICWGGSVRIGGETAGRGWMYPTTRRLVTFSADLVDLVASLLWTDVEALVFAPPHVTMTMWPEAEVRFAVFELDSEPLATSFYKTAVDAWRRRKKPRRPR